MLKSKPRIPDTLAEIYSGVMFSLIRPRERERESKVYFARVVEKTRGHPVLAHEGNYY